MKITLMEFVRSVASHARPIARRAALLVTGLVVFAAATLPGTLWGQPSWQTCGRGLCSSTGANVGIGTTSPTGKFQVVGSNGSIGLNPDYGSGYVLLQVSTVANGSFDINNVAAGGITRVYGDSGLQFRTASMDPAVTILKAGNVGIGTSSPQYKLAVNGTIGTKEVIVTNTGWADYVFKPGYQLKPLHEVAAYIQENHHLPDIPSETEVQEKGVSLGEMQAKLLAKIEELTLHVIQQDEENRQLRERIAHLEEGATAKP